MEIAGLLLAGAFTLVAAGCDVKTKKLPNVLTVPAFACGLLFHVVRGFVEDGWAGCLGSWRESGLLFALAGFATGFGILFVLWLIGGGGGGDVKFMGALGAWLGTILIFQVFIVGTVFVIFGSICAIVWHSGRIGLSGVKRKYLSRGGQSKASKPTDKGKVDTASRRRLIPFAVPIAFATWVVIGIHLYPR
jgi:prepilin peptidase CpaA